MILRSILCPVDFSEQSRHALRWAGALARRTNASLTVVNAVEPLLAQAALQHFGSDLTHAETEPALREFVAATWPADIASTIDARLDVQVGHPADVILETAAKASTDLVVMGTHGLGGIRKWLLGSTTERVLRRTRTPVLAVPPTVSDPTWSHTGAAPFEVGPVLAATDLLEASACAVGWAADLAQQVARPLLLVHVVESIAVPPRWQPYVADNERARVADARTRLHALAMPLTGSAKTQSLVEAGQPADSIAAIARTRGAVVIVMGLGGSPGPLGARPGSIAYRVLGLAAIPVLVVPPVTPAGTS